MRSKNSDRNSWSGIAHLICRAWHATAAGALVCAGIGVAVSQVSAPEDPSITPAGFAVNSSQYLTAHDGTKIAIDVWLPKELAQGEHIPALIKGSPYWRGPEREVSILNTRGYAVVAVDARGTGASFGSVKVMFSDAEVSDYGTVADWILRQPWSNGNVGAYGFSYRGITAANIASLPNPEIKAVAPLFDLTDLYLLAYPGGAFESYLVGAWSEQTRELNAGKLPCKGDPMCVRMDHGPKPVDADVDRGLLAQAIAQHAANYNVSECFRAAPARDDRICASGQSLSEVSVLARKAAIEKRGLPMFVVTGWLDESSPSQVLFRYRTFSNPQELIIGPFTHGGFESDDPFLLGRPLDVTYRNQTELMADFFDRYLKDSGSHQPVKSIRYYVNGAGIWRTTSTWPPSTTTVQRWYLAQSHRATPMPPSSRGVERYKVDFSATTGALSGYRGQVDLSRTNYGNRAVEDSRLLIFTSSPLKDDLEIAGDAIAHLRLSSSRTDGLLIVYLEDVAPDGVVTYVTQGVLRLAFRKLAASDASAYSADPLHTYLTADMRPMMPGRFEDVLIALSPTATLIRKEHRVRIALAGADDGNLERLPAQGDVTWGIAWGRDSYLEVPQVSSPLLRETPTALNTAGFR
jgi:putative CocE/NonD family hydrolase